MKNLSEQEELYYELSDIAHEMKIRVSDLIIVAKELEFGEVKPDDLFTLSEAKQLIARYDEKQNEPEKVPEKKDKGLLKKLRTKKDELFAPKDDKKNKKTVTFINKPKKKFTLKGSGTFKSKVLVYGTIGLLLSLSVGATTLSIMSRSKALSKPTVSVVSDKRILSETDNKVNVYMTSFIKSYFNYSSQNTGDYSKKLTEYFGDNVNMTYLPENKSDMKLVSSTLLKIENNLATYVVNYQVKENSEDKNSKFLDRSVEFNIPFASKADRFYVSDTPFVTALSELQGNNVKKQGLTKQTQDYTESEVKEFGTFLEAFFTAYTTDDKTLATMSADIVGIKGYKFDKLLYTYYAKGASGTTTAVVTVSFKDSLNSIHKENFELSIKKNGDTWFVKTLNHGVSQDYFKEEKEK